MTKSRLVRIKAETQAAMQAWARPGDTANDTITRILNAAGAKRSK